MKTLAETIAEKVGAEIFGDDVLKSAVPGSPERRYGLVKRAIAQGDLIHIRRGLYVLSKKYQRRGVNLYELAQRIYGPSYLSFESALAYHGWIPEAVYTVTSACSKRSKEFRTPLGTFAYLRIPGAPFFEGVERVDSSGGIFFMAAPWKALVDYVYVNKKDWTGIEPLVKDLRIEEDQLKQSDTRLLKELSKNVQAGRIRKFIAGVRRDLKR